MKVLVSWSGQRGRIVAEALRSWLADVLHRTDAWVSSEDIEPGTRWNSELAKQLEETQFGIVCLTPESAHAPWVLFEAGALAKTLGTARLVPYPIELESRELQQPLAQFDAVRANKSGTLKLLRSINKALESEGSLSDERLMRAFDLWWPYLERVLEGLPAAPQKSAVLPRAAESLGLEGVFRSRSEALTYFGPALRREIERSTRSQGLVYITCTSLRGFIATDAKDFHGPRVLEKLAENKCDLHILLTHPEVAERRAHQEQRPQGAIAGEVKSAVTQLTALGVSTDQIRYYRGSPTVFGIATSEVMLLNPYPYENESHRCMTLVVRKTDEKEDIYHQYFDAHFERPWKNAEPVQKALRGSP